MADSWLIKIEKKRKRDAEKSSRAYNKAIEITEDIRNKYNCGVADAPIQKLSEEEKGKIEKAYIFLGYSQDSAYYLSHCSK